MGSILVTHPFFLTSNLGAEVERSFLCNLSLKTFLRCSETFIITD